MVKKDEYDRFGFKIIGVSDEEAKILEDNGVKISIRAHGNAYFDYLSERNKGMDVLNKTRKIV